MRIRNEPTVFIVDDDEAIRNAINFLMRTEKLNAETFASAEEFLDYYKPQWPGVVILDVRMSGMNGLQLQETLNDKSIHIPIIIVTGHGDVPMAVQAMKMGAHDFVQKPFENEELLAKVRQCIDLDSQRRREEHSHDDVERRLASLTVRERQVMEMLIEGKRNKVIAGELGISSRTVEAHRSKIMEKMEVHSLSEVVRIALEGSKPG